MSAPATRSQTELAMDLQPGILGLDWQERLDAKARAALKGASRVTFIGTGTSYHCAMWADWLCRLFGEGKVPSRAVSAWDFFLGNYLEDLPRSEVLVVISHRGNRNLTKKLLDFIGPRRRHILVCGENAPIDKHPHVFTSPQEVSNAHTMSLIGAMGAVSEIVARLLPAKAATKLRMERETAAALLLVLSESGTELGEAIGGIMTRGAGLHFVGGGPFHPIAFELALKAREIVHVAALAYNTEEFLHGPLASVDEQDTLVLLKPFDAMAGRAVPRLLYHKRLEACRKAAEAIGALVLEPAWDKTTANTAARLNLAWQSLLPLYWGQALCLSTAKAWGLNPDLNRREDPRYEEARLQAEL